MTLRTSQYVDIRSSMEISNCAKQKIRIRRRIRRGQNLPMRSRMGENTAMALCLNFDNVVARVRRYGNANVAMTIRMHKADALIQCYEYGDVGIATGKTRHTDMG